MIFIEKLLVDENAITFLGLPFYIQITCKLHTNYLLHKQSSVLFNEEIISYMQYSDSEGR